MDPATLTLSGVLATAVGALWLRMLAQEKAFSEERERLLTKLERLQAERLEDTKLMSALLKKYVPPRELR